MQHKGEKKKNGVGDQTMTFKPFHFVQLFTKS